MLYELLALFDALRGGAARERQIASQLLPITRAGAFIAAPYNALRLLVDPTAMEAEIGVDFLARCFGESWNPVTYHWYLKREFYGEAPGRLVLAEGRQVLATAGIACQL